MSASLPGYKMTFLIFLVFLGASVSAQSDQILVDNVKVEGSQVTHQLEARADIEDVRVVDFYTSNVSGGQKNFLGDKYSVINRDIGDMRRGESKQLNYTVSFSGYALLGASTYRYRGEKHRLSPERVNAEKENEVNKDKILLGLIIFTAISVVLFRRIRP